MDDLLENVLSVTEAMDNMGLDCIGIHYRAAYSSSSAINIEQARGQIEHFLRYGCWISDAEWEQQ